ncbi:MAG: NAD-dependent deacylase [Nitrospinota bacterium]
MFSREAVERLRRARSVAVLTGAGVSAESGVPTFRGAGGLWRSHNPLTLASVQAFARDPKLVWEFYNWRREVLAPLKPNPGHYALAAIEARAPRFTLVTQNVDNLHRAAGSANLIELHGNLWRVRCSNMDCGEAFLPREDRRVPIEPLPPVCGRCGSLLRPHIVWFGEMLDPENLRSAALAAKECDYMIVAGTSGAVQPAASMPLAAMRAGAYVVEVNPEPTELSGLLSECVQAPSGQALPRLAEAAFGGSASSPPRAGSRGG